MKTASEFLEPARLYILPNVLGLAGETQKADFNKAVEIMKEYAREVAEQTLKEASERSSDHWKGYGLSSTRLKGKKVILTTNIITP